VLAGSEPADWLAVFELIHTRGSRAPEPPIGAATAIRRLAA